MSKDPEAFVVPITDDTRDALKWLAVAQALDGNPCAICGLPWTCREDVVRRVPVVAGDRKYACAACWEQKNAN